jgi:hypothetical protein
MAPEGFGQHDRAGYPTEGAVETQLADECHPCDRAGIQLPGCHQQSDGNREVETRASLAHARWSQIDCHPTERPGKPTREESGPNPVSRLTNRGIGKTDHREAGKSVGHVNFD